MNTDESPPAVEPATDGTGSGVTPSGSGGGRGSGSESSAAVVPEEAPADSVEIGSKTVEAEDAPEPSSSIAAAEEEGEEGAEDTDKSDGSAAGGGGGGGEREDASEADGEGEDADEGDDDGFMVATYFERLKEEAAARRDSERENQKNIPILIMVFIPIRAPLNHLTHTVSLPLP